MSADEYAYVRPTLAIRAFWTTVVYIFAFELGHGFGRFDAGASLELCAVLVAPTMAFLGLRTYERHSRNKHAKEEGVQGA